VRSLGKFTIVLYAPYKTKVTLFTIESKFLSHTTESLDRVQIAQETRKFHFGHLPRRHTQGKPKRDFLATAGNSEESLRENRRVDHSAATGFDTLVYKDLEFASWHIFCCISWVRLSVGFAVALKLRLHTARLNDAEIDCRGE
jgi:hypothetical protein